MTNARSLSHDHKPELDDEKKRIVASGGRVAKYLGIIINL
jgi:hypothetical protein